MTKFNVGDTLQFIEKYGSYEAGDKVTLIVYQYDQLISFEGKNGAGCALESRFELADKPTKNQRITALENEVAELRPLKQEVAELKLIVHELRGKKSIEPSTTNPVEDIIEFEGKQYRKVDREARDGDVVIFSKSDSNHVFPDIPYEVKKGSEDRLKVNDISLYNSLVERTQEVTTVYELIETKPLLTPNQQRAAIIEKAKKFVDENLKLLISYDFVVNNNGLKLYSRQRYQDIRLTTAKCKSSDVFNEHIGKAIALGRSLGLDVSEFEQAVQPSEVVPGHIIVWNETPDEPHKVVQKNGDWFDFLNLKNNKNYNNFEYCEIEEFTTILNDTNAIYKEG